MSILGDIERFVADLYEYRLPITIGLVLAAELALGFAYRSGWHVIVWRHKLASSITAIVLLAVAIPLGNELLSPLWERSFLEEASPIVAASEPDVAADESGPAVLRRGEWKGEDSFHFAEGTALILERAPGEYVLRVEDFSVRNGPDLFVYLSPDADGYTDGAINLGELKATDGAFNYEIPPGTDISEFRSAVVWCRRFSVGFDSAELIEA